MLSHGRWRVALAVVGALVAMTTVAGAGAAEPVRVHAAGSLRAVLAELTSTFTRTSGVPVQVEYGASGLLLRRLAAGAPSDVFLSANLEHPQVLARAGKAGPVVLFARNEICALARRVLGLTPETLPDRLLDPAVRLGTSTPKADPSGDYAWEAFRKAGSVRQGSRERLEAMALQSTGGPSSPPPPPARSVYGLLLERGEADVFLTYCTNTAQAVREVPGLESIPLPAALRVGADYGLTVLAGAPESAYRFALFVLSPAGQGILEHAGFTAPGRPRPAGS